MQRLKAIAPIIVILTLGGITQLGLDAIFSPAQSKPKTTQVQRRNQQRPPVRQNQQQARLQQKRPVAQWAKPAAQTSQEKCANLTGTANVRCVMAAEFPMSRKK